MSLQSVHLAVTRKLYLALADECDANSKYFSVSFLCHIRALQSSCTFHIRFVKNMLCSSLPRVTPIGITLSKNLQTHPIPSSSTIFTKSASCDPFPPKIRSDSLKFGGSSKFRRQKLSRTRREVQFASIRLLVRTQDSSEVQTICCSFIPQLSTG